MPAAFPVKLTEQVAFAPLPLSTQLALVGDTPAPLAVTVNVPLGVVCEPLFESVTCTVQLLICPTVADDGQLTVVMVG